MVEFSTYVSLAYEIARSQPWYSRYMEGDGTAPRHRQFMSDLADAYNENGHEMATESQARQFLNENVGPP